MKKISKHIDKLRFVKVYICDREEQSLTHFEGIIFDQNDDFIYMCDLSDFNYDGFVVLRKEDICDIKRSENEKFFNRILTEEEIVQKIKRRRKQLDFDLGDMEDMFRQLKKMNMATIVECLYESEESFQIGPIVKCKEKKMKIDYFNSRGEYDIDPVSVRYKDITFFRIDSPYANLFYKYAEHPEMDESKSEKESKKKNSKKEKRSKSKSKKGSNKKKKQKEKNVASNSKKDKKPKKKKYEKPRNVQRLMLVV